MLKTKRKTLLLKKPVRLFLSKMGPHLLPLVMARRAIGPTKQSSHIHLFWMTSPRFRARVAMTALLLCLNSPLYAQNFGTLLEELAGSDEEEVASSEEEEVELESETPPELPQAPPPSAHIPSSNELQAAELENPSEDDDLLPQKNSVTNGVTLQGLDKQTARVFIIDAPIGQPIEFGTLKIVVQHCEKAPQRQESMAFVRITEQKANSHPHPLFSGWMFSSSPALSALDHPVYDVWVKECKVLE